MYTTTFALAAILSVALVNLFLGFAFASLMGRGPHRWRDADKAIVVRRFSTSLLLPGWRRKAAEISAAAPLVPKQATVASVTNAIPASTPKTPALPPPAFAAAATVPSSPSPTARLVLTPKDEPDKSLGESTEEALQRQLNAWLANEQRIETPSLCGLCAIIREPLADPAIAGAVMKAVTGQVATQLRKDRRILQPHENRLVWFAADTHPDDGLMPISRIRLILEKTRFLVGETPLTLELATALISVNAGDTPATLLKRMQQTLAYAREKGAGSVCVELGSGPTLVDPIPLDVDASECVVA
jgi:hypothetical protein